jgi:hypothetical protein
MRIERHDHRRDAELPGPLHGVADDVLMSTMDTVEDTDGDH